MAFWGVELKPGKPYTHQYEDERGRLHVSQATLGDGSKNKKSIVQCKVGDNKPIYMCSLLPEKLETCQLNLEFEEEEEVTFSVVGSHTVHLSGFFYGESEDGCGHEHGTDLYDDTAETDSGSDDSIEFEYDSEDEDDDDSIDDEFDMYPPSPLRNSGVKIEEIVEDENPTDENGTSKRPKKKKKQSNGTENSERQIVVKKNADVQLLESEDEDGFPVSASNENKADSVKSKLKSDGMKDQDTREEALEKKAINNADQKKGLKRVSDDISQANDHPRGDNTSAEKNKKNKKKKLMHGDEVAHENGSKSSVHQKQAEAEVEPVPVGNTDDGQRSADDKVKEKKKKKKKNKNNQQDGIIVTDVELDKKNGSQVKVEENAETKPSQVRSYGNGLVIEELAMGKPDGKRASPGKKVSVHYIGKLKKNGKIFDSNIGRSPFKFRLGVGQVIKGWDVGVSGMRIGDKRRITIPPAMGYGSKGAGADIPPNSWLVFDVELKDVN